MIHLVFICVCVHMYAYVFMGAVCDIFVCFSSTNLCILHSLHNLLAAKTMFETKQTKHAKKKKNYIDYFLFFYSIRLLFRL